MSIFYVRGFQGHNFRDANGAFCSIQESSAARLEDEDGSISEGKLWLGMDKENDGSPVGKWVTPPGVHLGARMHLTQSHVKELLPLLTYFAEHGELPELKEDE